MTEILYRDLYQKAINVILEQDRAYKELEAIANLSLEVQTEFIESMEFAFRALKTRDLSLTIIENIHRSIEAGLAELRQHQSVEA